MILNVKTNDSCNMLNQIYKQHCEECDMDIQQ